MSDINSTYQDLDPVCWVSLIFAIKRRPVPQQWGHNVLILLKSEVAFPLIYICNAISLGDGVALASGSPQLSERENGRRMREITEWFLTSPPESNDLLTSHKFRYQKPKYVRSYRHFAKCTIIEPTQRCLQYWPETLSPEARWNLACTM